jgi:hypothetical protein
MDAIITAHTGLGRHDRGSAAHIGDKSTGARTMAKDDGRTSTEELERLRRAAEDALQQLDWCIGYLHGLHKTSEARVLARNRSYIRRQLLHQAEEATPEEAAS